MVNFKITYRVKAIHIKYTDILPIYEKKHNHSRKSQKGYKLHINYMKT